MKVDSIHITKLFTEIKSIVEGVKETIMIGDDGLEDSISQQVDDIKKVIAAFSIDYMTPVQKEVKSEHYFLKRHEELHDKSQGDEGLNPRENSLLFKARLYLFIKKELAKRDVPKTIDHQALSNFIEGDVIAGTHWESYWKTDFVMDMYNVCDVIVVEIITELKKHPQLGLFDTVKKSIQDNSLLSKLENNGIRI